MYIYIYIHTHYTYTHNYNKLHQLAAGPPGGPDAPRVRDEQRVTGVGYQFALKE